MTQCRCWAIKYSSKNDSKAGTVCNPSVINPIDPASVVLHFQLGNRKIEMIETKTDQELLLPCESTQKTRRVPNRFRNTCAKLDPRPVRWFREKDIRSRGSFAMALLIDGALRKPNLIFKPDSEAVVEMGFDVGEHS